MASWTIREKLSQGAILLWAICSYGAIFVPGSALAVPAQFLAIAMLLAFCLIHGGGRLGNRGILILLVIALIVSNIYENLSISTGFPFGRYVHTAASGPMLFQVPLIVGPIFFSVSYIAWTLATMLLGEPADARIDVKTPIVAAFIVVGWDLCSDPIGATIGKQWLFAHSGAYFGVPLSNYLGWFLCTWTIFQCWSVYLSTVRAPIATMSLRYWYEASAYWALIGLQYPLLALANPVGRVVRDTGGWAWRSSDILQASAILSIYTMLAAAVTSAIVVAGRQRSKSSSG